MNPWDFLLDTIHDGLELLHGIFEPLAGAHAWGWAIIGLTVVIRVLLLPLAIKQTRSMRAMQALQPQIKKIQARYKTDREMMKKDPERYRERKQKMNEEVMALYKERGVNPAAGCLPLLLQAPIFFALFRVLNDPGFESVANGPFYVFSPLGEQARQSVWGWVLIVAMAATMFITQWQMSGRTSAEGTQAQQQKILMYVMPVFLAFIAQSLPLGVLLYWVTTNLWQLGQQAIIKYEVEHHPEGPGAEAGGNGQPTGPVKGPGSPTRRERSGTGGQPKRDQPDRPTTNGRDHLPRKRGRSG